MMFLKNLKWWHVLVGILVICGMPVLLNYILQINTNAKILGDEVTWLNFWAVYIGSILTGLMVVASYITIDKTIKLSISQRKLEWLNEYRKISSSLLMHHITSYNVYMKLKLIVDDECYRSRE